MPDRLRKYVETLAYGKRTGRLAYMHGQRPLPEPIAGAEWAEDKNFNAADELLMEHGLKTLFKRALEKGVAMKTEK